MSLCIRLNSRGRGGRNPDSQPGVLDQRELGNSVRLAEIHPKDKNVSASNPRGCFESLLS